MEYYSAIKNKAVFTGEWMEPKILIASAVRRLRKFLESSLICGIQNNGVKV